MRSKSAISKLKAILIIDLIIVASAVAGVFYISSLPAPPLEPIQIQLTDLNLNQTVLSGQPVTVSFNATNLAAEAGTYEANLYVDGVLAQTKTIQLDSSETKVVEFVISNAEEGLHTVRIGSLEGTFTVQNIFILSDLAINRTEAQVGEPIGISVKIANRASESGTYSVTLKVNGASTETKTGQLNAGESTTVLFEIVEQTEGTYSFAIGSQNGTFKITASAPPAKPAEFQVTTLVIDPDIAEQGTPVDISVKVTNVGELTGTHSVSLTINGAVKETKEVQLSGGTTTTVKFTVTESTKGSYTVKVGDLTGTLSIQGPSTISLTALVVRPYEVWAGDTVTVIAKGTNQAAEASSLSVKLRIDNEVVETKTLHIAGGSTGEVQFSVIAKALEAGQNSKSYSINVGTLSGGFLVVKSGYHTLNVAVSPAGTADFTFIYPNGTSVPRKTFWSDLLPEGTYTVVMPLQDPTGRYTYENWDDGSLNPSRTVTLTSRTTVTANYKGGSSCPSMYMWNGTHYVFVSDVSNHGWLGYTRYVNSDGSLDYWRNNPWDYIPLAKGQLQPIDGYYQFNLTQRWDEIFFIDAAHLMVVDHPADVSVYSTMVEQYIDPAYMGQIYTVNNNPLKPVSAFNEIVTVYNGTVTSSANGVDALSQISNRDGVFTTGFNGKYSEAWNNQTWNRLTLDLGNLTGAPQIKLVVTSLVDWGPAESYTLWMDKFYSTTVPDHTEPTPTPFMEVKDANGNWIRVPEDRQFPLPPDGVARTFVVDLTGLFPTNDYSIRISNFWNVTFDYIGIDITPTQNVTIHKIDPQALLYQQFAPTASLSSGNFTKYGDVTPLLLNEDDMFVIGRQGDTVSLQFPATNLPPLAAGMERDYFFFVSCWFKVQYANYGFGPGNNGFTVTPLPFHYMSGFPYPLDTESYPYDAEHLAYLAEWNTRVIPSP